MGFMDDIPEHEGVGRASVVPESFYPIRLSLDCCDKAKNTDTVGIYLVGTVTEGPYAGTELDKYATCIWVWAPNPTIKSGKNAGKPNERYAEQCSQQLGYLKHFCKAMTGRLPNEASAESHGFSGDNAVEFWEWYGQLDPQDAILFLRDFLYLDLWRGGQDVIAKIEMKTEPMVGRDGMPVLDETGNQRAVDRNSLVNIFERTHNRYGYANWKQAHLPAQERAYKVQFGG